MQYSVYARVCNGMDAVETHRARLRQHIPAAGAVRALVITEKQFENIDLLLGAPGEVDEDFQTKQQSIF